MKQPYPIVGLLDKALKVLYALVILMVATGLLAAPVRADDQSDFTVTVNADVSPTTITGGQIATGSASGGGVAGNSATATAELTNASPTQSFDIDSVEGGKAADDTCPSASINADGTSLDITASDATSADTYTITVRDTYTWTDSNGTKHTPYGTTTVTVTVPPDKMEVDSVPDLDYTSLYGETSASFTIELTCNGTPATNIASQSYVISSTATLDSVSAPDGFTVTYSDDGSSATITSNNSVSPGVSATVQVTSCIGGLAGYVTCSGQATTEDGANISDSGSVQLNSADFCL